MRDIWIMLNKNLEKAYKPYGCITIDEQLFPFIGRNTFTQYIPSKPAKYDIGFLVLQCIKRIPTVRSDSLWKTNRSSPTSKRWRTNTFEPGQFL